MNEFDFRGVRNGLLWEAEYKLCHRTWYARVKDERGKPETFPSKLEAENRAARAAFQDLNGNPEYWRGGSPHTAARAAAEALFTATTRTDDGKGRTEAKARSEASAQWPGITLCASDAREG